MVWTLGRDSRRAPQRRAARRPVTRRGVAQRAMATAAAVAAALALGGCQFSRPPASATSSATNRPKPVLNPAAERLADAPALLIQCVVDRGVLTPAGSDWFSGGRVRISSSNAQDFAAWWHAYFTPGPYKQTFTIDGHKTHYLAFGARWTLKNGAWVPLHRAVGDPAAQRTSLYAWSLWTANHDVLPAQVCGPGASARNIQREVFGNRTPDPWSS